MQIYVTDHAAERFRERYGDGMTKDDIAAKVAQAKVVSKQKAARLVVTHRVDSSRAGVRKMDGKLHEKRSDEERCVYLHHRDSGFLFVAAVNDLRQRLVVITGYQVTHNREALGL